MERQSISPHVLLSTSTPQAAVSSGDSVLPPRQNALFCKIPSLSTERSETRKGGLSLSRMKKGCFCWAPCWKRRPNTKRHIHAKEKTEEDNVVAGMMALTVAGKPVERVVSSRARAQSEKQTVGGNA